MFGSKTGYDHAGQVQPPAGVKLGACVDSLTCDEWDRLRVCLACGVWGWDRLWARRRGMHEVGRTCVSHMSLTLSLTCDVWGVGGLVAIVCVSECRIGMVCLIDCECWQWSETWTQTKSGDFELSGYNAEVGCESTVG
eukprot:58051-Rhodomonas_salina.2